MLFYHYNGFKSSTLSRQITISNFFGTYLAYLEVSLYIVLTNKIVSYLRYRQAFANLFTLNLNLDTICFVIFKPKLYIFVLVNQSRCQLRAIFSTREALSTSCSPPSPEFLPIFASDRFVRFYTVLLCTPIIRVLTLNEIRSALSAAGIESNPGPEQTVEPNPLAKLEIVTVNCNGLTCNVRLLQTISRIKKR